MDVTRQNFYDLYPILKEKLLTCKFYSFDEEMTGINNSDPSQRYQKDDTPSQRYPKMSVIATKYSILQFGLCFFHDAPDGNGFIASPYNFYLFPDSGPDIVMSTSSIDFLRKNNMDFGTWIGKGVPFVDTKGEEWLRKKHNIIDEESSQQQQQPPQENKKGITLTRKSDIDFMDSNFELFKLFINDPNQEIFEFQECNAYLRRYIYQQVEGEYADQVIIKKSDSSYRLCAYKISKESKVKHELEQKLQRENAYSLALGFRRLFNDLVQSKKPIVGHNNMFDLLFMMRWFDGPLVKEFQEFRQHLSQKFSSIFDTKYIESSSGLIQDPALDTVLEQCYQKYLKKSVIPISVHSDCSSFDPSKGNFHNAGYDAYCTGYIFANQIYQANGSLQLLPNSTQSLFEATENRVFSMVSLFDINLNPNAPSCALSKHPGSFLLRITHFPKEVKTETFLDVEKTTAASASAASPPSYEENLEIIWIDDFSLFLVFPLCASEDDPRVVNYKNLAPSQWKFQTLNEFVSSREQPKVDEVMEQVAVEEEEVVVESPKKDNTLLSRAVNAMLSPFRWAANVEQGDEEEEKKEAGTEEGKKRKRFE